ncbi:unnamed protein product [Didymodactylos carnosus]|nr:unnamed protein product [Didymodactylos carnosus]CAF3789665.1 unnamed protein product [Didymodactylos carnosus]
MDIVINSRVNGIYITYNCRKNLCNGQDAFDQARHLIQSSSLLEIPDLIPTTPVMTTSTMVTTTTSVTTAPISSSVAPSSTSSRQRETTITLYSVGGQLKYGYYVLLIAVIITYLSNITRRKS